MMKRIIFLISVLVLIFTFNSCFPGVNITVDPGFSSSKIIFIGECGGDRICNDIRSRLSQGLMRMGYRLSHSKSGAEYELNFNYNFEIDFLGTKKLTSFYLDMRDLSTQGTVILIQKYGFSELVMEVMKNILAEFRKIR